MCVLRYMQKWSVLFADIGRCIIGGNCTLICLSMSTGSLSCDSLLVMAASTKSNVCVVTFLICYSVIVVI